MPFTLSLMLMGSAGCVIPPSLTVDNQDAGLNSPPAILAVRSDTAQIVEPGPVAIVRGPTAGTLSVEVIDTDLADTLYVQIFVDYRIDDPMPARSACVAAASGAAKRSCPADLIAVCQSADVVGPDQQLPLMNVRVFDRMPLPVGDPPFQAMPEGGLSTGMTFQLDCENPQT